MLIYYKSGLNGSYLYAASVVEHFTYNCFHLFVTLSSNITFVNVQILLSAACAAVVLQVCICLPTCAHPPYTHTLFPLYQMSHLPV